MTSAFIEQRERLIALLVNTPVLGKGARALGRFAPLRRLAGRGGFDGSEAYWRQRYVTGGTSGAGSYGRLARFKAEVLNAFVAEQKINSVLEYGSGDGAQLAMAEYPSYVGIDVSPVALDLCRKRFFTDTTKRFYLPSEMPADLGPFDLVISLDVIYHLVEDAVFEAYMARLFASARRFVAIYSSDTTLPATTPHVRHREFTRWIARHAPGWKLIKFEKNPYDHDPARPDDTSFANMYFFQPMAAADE